MRRACLIAVLSFALAPAGAAAAPAIRAQRGSQPAFVDSLGRQVILHGVNVSQLARYVQFNEHPNNTPLTADDYREMHALGFNVQRLLLSWSEVEPSPGVISSAYLDRVAEAVGWARRAGITTIIDMHQDAWSAGLKARADELCAPGFTPNRGWDGAPDWATLDDGLPRCAANGIRELSPAVAQAWQSFWDDRAGPDGTGIQEHLVAAWSAIAQRFASVPGVLGYDLLNEPHPGYAALGAESLTIARFDRRAIAAIRAHDRDRVIFVEPNILRSAISDPIVMPSISGDPNLAYAPHLYADRNGYSPDGTGTATDREWRNAEREAGQAGGGASSALPLLIGEFGFLDPPARTAYNSELMGRADAHLASWTFWVWKETCGNPHYQYGPVPPESLWTWDCAASRYTGLKAHRVQSLARPYAQAATGRIERMSFDERTRRFELVARAGPGSGKALAPTRVLVPITIQYGSRKRMRITTSNTGRVRLRRRSDGTASLSVRPHEGRYSITIERR